MKHNKRIHLCTHTCLGETAEEIISNSTDASARQAAHAIDLLAEQSPQVITDIAACVLGTHIHLTRLSTLEALAPEGHALLNWLTAVINRAGLDLEITAIKHTPTPEQDHL